VVQDGDRHHCVERPRGERARQDVADHVLDGVGRRVPPGEFDGRRVAVDARHAIAPPAEGEGEEALAAADVQHVAAGRHRLEDERAPVRTNQIIGPA